MKITAVETIHVWVPLSRPTGPAGAFNAARQTIVVRIATDAGITGWGETYALAGVRAAIDQVLRPLLLGADPCAVDIVQPDVAICGGIADALFVAECAAQQGITCAPHTWNGGIMHAASLHVAALLPEPGRVAGRAPAPLEYDTTENPLITGLLAEPPSLVNGAFRVPTAPGLGVTIDEAWVRAHALEA